MPTITSFHRDRSVSPDSIHGATTAGHVTVIVFLVYFLLPSGNHFRTRVLEIAGTHLEQRRITARIIDDININAQIQRFLLVNLVTASVVALATWSVLAWMRVGQAAVWAFSPASSIPSPISVRSSCPGDCWRLDSCKRATRFTR